jgi:hypothetical protein
MSLNNVGLSPAWLGVLAIASFGGLVAAAFASGYHLASDVPIDSDLAAGRAAAEASAGAELDSVTTFAPIPGRIAEPLVDRERAVLLKEPGESGVVDQLPAGRRVTISRESGDFLFLRYERNGREHEGWAHRINIEREEP